MHVIPSVILAQEHRWLLMAATCYIQGLLMAISPQTAMEAFGLRV